jgi:hypothetical protein
MARDLSLPLREAIVSHLRADGSFTAKVPAEQVHGMRQPAETPWPFTRYGSPDSRPFRAQCLDGLIVDVTLHIFSKEDYENECAEILSAMARSLEGSQGKGIVLALDGGGRAHIRWKGSQILPDAAEASAWHGLAHIEATISS